MPGFLQRVRPSIGVRGAVLLAVLLVAFLGCGDVMHQGPGGDLEDSADGLFDGHLSDQEVNPGDVNPGDVNPGDVALDGSDATLDADAQLDSQSDVAETAGNEAPSLEFLKPTEGAFVQVGMAVAVSLHVDDDGGVANVTVEIALQGASAVFFSGVAPADGNIAADLPGLQAGVQTLVATATDAQGKATAVVRKLYVNTAPGAAVVLIEPATPTTLDALQSVVVTEAADIDRAANLLTYQYMWMRDGELTAFIGASVPALTAKRGETWMVKVFAADPYSQGAAGEASVVIDDAAPSTPTVAFDKLQCDLATEISCTILQPSLDADGDAVTYTYHWYVNGAEDPSATADHVLVATLQSATGPIEQGSKIQCVVMASDGTKTSAAAASGELTVGVLDVCLSPLNPCSPLASCQGSTTLSVVCTCKSGYDGNGLVCTDIDECAINTDGCAVNADCSNLVGNFQCLCKAGYIGSGASCTDIDECLQQSDNCADTAVCSNTPGSFTCACKPGYAGNGTNCTDINECAAANGGCGNALYFTCENQQGQPVKCADIDECAAANGGCGSASLNSCLNQVGAPPICSDINECLVANGGCGNALFFVCENQAGLPPKCSDIDECAVANGGCGSALLSSCVNQVGAPPLCSDIDECLIANGGCGVALYTACSNVVADSPICSDIDECASGNGGCGDAQFFKCVNQIGGPAQCSEVGLCALMNGGCGNAQFFLCTDVSGGLPTCTDIDECKLANGGCGNAKYTLCKNNIGSTATCTDIDECAVANGGCDIHADCTNKLAAAAVCTCKAGFAMVGGVCVGNTPEASSVGFGGASGCLAIGYSLYQAQELPVSATVQYSVGNSGVWLSATPASGGDGLTQLATGAVKPGKSHVFLWNSSVDIAGDATTTSKDVSFRVIPSLGAVVGLPGMATGVVHTGFALQTPSLVAVGPKPRAVMTGDVNRDGKPDMLVVNSNGSGPGSVSVRLGNGLGQFTNGAAVAVGNGPLHGVIADFNRDGKLDWAVANFSGGAAGSLSIALGNGDGTFQAITSLATGAGPAYVATADLNLDGLPDLGVANVVGGTVTLFIGKGDGSFTASAVAAGPTGGMAFADLNEDGKPDLVSATAGNVVQVRPGAGDGSFGAAISQALSVAGTIQDLVVADWNRDGHLDVLACSVFGDSLAILVGDGKGGLLPITQTAIANTTSYRSLEVGDFNQDGNPDVALGGTGSAMGLSLYLGTGGPGSSGGYSATTGGIWDLAVADFNLDGVSDFAAAVDGLETVAVVLGQLPLRCDWALELPVTYVSATGTTGLTAADLNHDGIVDLVSANAGNGTVGTLLGKSDGVFATPAVLTSSGANTSAVVTGDFNRDGSLDVASVNSASSMGTISVLMTVNGGPGFAAAVSIDACPGAKGLVTADLNRDGYLDLATACTTQFAVLLGKADGSFAPALLTPLGGSPQGIATGDFNRDGIADLAFALFGSTAVSVQLGKGDGTFTAISPIPAGTGGGLWSLGSGDFNHDGAADLLVVAESAGTFRLLMGKGDGTFAPAVAVAVEASNPHHAVVVDLNSDGDLDFVVGYYGTGHLGVYLGDGKGGFALHTLYSGIEGGAFDSIIAGDFDRDGRIDIAVAMGGVNNKIAVFLQGQQGCQNQGPAVVLLGSAGNFVALAKAAISSVPTSVVTGNIGVSPAAASYITGFSLVADSTNVFSTATQVAGKVFAANYAVPSPANMTTAIADMELAYVDAAGRPNPDHVELGAGEIGGLTLKAGLYKWTSTVKISEHLVLSGCASDVWILQTSGDLTMASAKKVILSGGAQAKNVFWQVAGQATIGAGAHFEGVILSKTGITLETGASMTGRALAQTAVALQQATLAP